MTILIFASIFTVQAPLQVLQQLLNIQPTLFQPPVQVQQQAQLLRQQQPLQRQQPQQQLKRYRLNHGSSSNYLKDLMLSSQINSDHIKRMVSYYIQFCCWKLNFIFSVNKMVKKLWHYHHFWVNAEHNCRLDKLPLPGQPDDGSITT